MDLGERKKKILGIIVNAYIRSGEPVGSKAVVDNLGLEISSATIRNEMSVLEELGYLHQPHTSAGRVPSASGYRLFVDKIMQKHKLTQEEIHNIDDFITTLRGSLSALEKESAQIAAEFTDCAAVSVAPVSGGIIKMLEAVIAGKRLIAILTVSGSGDVRTKLCITDCNTETQNVNLLSRILNDVLGGLYPETISELRLAMLENEIRKHCPDLICVLPELTELLNELKGYDVFVGGEAKVFNYPEFSDIKKAKAFLSLLNKHENLARLACEKPLGGISVDVFSEINDVSMISSGYKLGNSNGYLCVFGPTRLDYARVLAKMNYFTDTMSKIINSTYFKDK